MHLAPLSRLSLFAIPLLLFITGCDTVGETSASNGTTSYSSTYSPSGLVTIAVAPSQPIAGEELTLSLDMPSSYNPAESNIPAESKPVWTTEDGTLLLGRGHLVEYTFREPGEYNVTVSNLPGDQTEITQPVYVGSEPTD
jgi:hypothetical protein